MKLLLDTHALLWVLSGDPRLSKTAARAYQQTGDVAFSMVSLWEIGIKIALQKDGFALDRNWWKDIPATLVSQGVARLDVEPGHCGAVGLLPWHHRDPFDRMLIAQAMETGRALLSADSGLDPYGVKRIW